MRRLLIPALLIVGSLPLFAHSGHVILASQVTTTTVEYHSGHKATWRAEVVDADQKLIKYTLKLERPATDDGKEPISLYNLRLQGRLWTVRVASAPGIQFYNTLDDAEARRNPILKDPKTGEWTIRHAATHPTQGDLNTQEDRVAMLVWGRDGTGKDNTCEIVVYSDRKVRGPLSRLSKAAQAKDAKEAKSGPVLNLLEGHHSEPPPGTPGGEEGEPR